jgi:hypothetical protein
MSDDEKPVSVGNALPVGIERFIVSVKITPRMWARLDEQEPTEKMKQARRRVADLLAQSQKT